MKRILLLSLGVAALCLTATPARADLFQFTISNTRTTLSGGTLTTTIPSLSTGIVTRLVNPGLGDVALFGWPTSGSASFVLTLSTGGTGSFTWKDGVDADQLIGTVDSGTWTRESTGYYTFSGTLGNVQFGASSNGEFDGNLYSTSISSSFVQPIPWSGSISMQLGMTPLFTDPWLPSGYTGGGLSGVVSAVPIPGAVLLGFLGLSAAGVGLRKLM